MKELEKRYRVGQIVFLNDRRQTVGIITDVFEDVGAYVIETDDGRKYEVREADIGGLMFE